MDSASANDEAIALDSFIAAVITTVRDEVFGGYRVDPATGHARRVPWRTDGTSFRDIRQQGRWPGQVGFTLLFTSDAHPAVLFGRNFSIPFPDSPAGGSPVQEALYALRVLEEELDYGFLPSVEACHADTEGVTWV